jgi:hypothetical protein
MSRNGGGVIIPALITSVGDQAARRFLEFFTVNIRMVRRGASDAGIHTTIGCRTFRAAGMTDYLTNGGCIEVEQRMAGHPTAKPTALYDRRNDEIGAGEAERIGI